MPRIAVSRFSFSSAPISSWFIPISTMPSRFNFRIFNFCVQVAVSQVCNKNWTLPKHNRNKIKVFIFKTFGELEIKIREYLSTNKTILTNWTWNETSSDLYKWFNLFEFYKNIASSITTDLNELHFRWLHIKGFDAAIHILLTLHLNYLNWNWS